MHVMETKSVRSNKASKASEARKYKRKVPNKKAFSRPSTREKKEVHDTKNELTPLHRLRRFQAIRDRNFRKDPIRCSEGNKKVKMEEVNSGLGAEEPDVAKDEIVVNKKLFQNGNSNDNVHNGYSLENKNDKAEKSEIDVGFQELKTNDQEESVNNENESSLQGSEGKTYDEASKGDSSNLESITISTSQDHNPEDNSSESDINVVDEDDERGQNIEDFNKVEGIDVKDEEPEQVCEFEDAAQENESEFEEQVNDVEDDQVRDIEDYQQKDSDEGEKESEKVFVKDGSSYGLRGPEMKITNNWLQNFEIPKSSTVARSTDSSCSYSSTTYRDLGRIGGRRPVREIYGKRKAIDDGNKESKRIYSPSLGSPRWKYIPVSLNKFWTPRTAPSAFTSTPTKNLDDSLEVNFDERTIYTHDDDDDDDLMLEKENNNSRWFCNIM